MDKYYIGFDTQTGNYQLFRSYNPADATPEASGYDEVSGPFDTREEAEENMPDGNM